MAYSATTQPNKYSAGYSAMPLRLVSDQSTTLENFQYVTNITWDKVSVTSLSSYAINNVIYTNCICSTEHNFAVGDVLLFDDGGNGNAFTDYYIIRKIISTTSFVIDLPYEYSPTNPISVSKVIKYLMPTDPDGEAKLDISNTLKNFVTENLEDTSELFAAPDTLFRYDITCGSEYNYIFQFTGLGQHTVPTPPTLTTYITLINSGMTSTSDQEFKVGDVILIQQDLYQWSYTDNYFMSGNLGFTGTTAFPNVPNGTNLTVTGQITEPYYNGPTTLTSVAADGLSIKTDKSWTTNTPAEGGIIYFAPHPEFNTSAIITNIEYVVGVGVVIRTDMVYSGILTSVSGKASGLSTEISKSLNQLSITGNTVYNARLETLDYSIDGFDKYVCQNRSYTENNISTILGNTDKYRIEPSTKSWLLAHNHYAVTNTHLSPRFSFYDVNGTLLSQMKYDFPTLYGPQVAINTWANNGGFLRVNCNSAHGLQVGDTLQIFQATASYLGVTTVISVQSTVALTVDVVYVGNSIFGAEYLKKITTNYVDDFYFPIGINQLVDNSQITVQSGSTLSAVTTDVDYYKVELEKLGSVASNAIWYEVNNDCASYDILHLMWKDAKGSWLSMPFNYKSRNNIEVERKNYYKSTGNWDNNTFGYDSFGRGDKTFYSRSRESKIVNSGWLEEFENVLIKDLFKSASLYVQLPDGTLVGCQLNDTSIELIKSENLELIQYEFTINYSRNEYRW